MDRGVGASVSVCDGETGTIIALRGERFRFLSNRSYYMLYLISSKLTFETLAESFLLSVLLFQDIDSLFQSNVD